MGDDLRSGAGGPVFGVQVCSEGPRNWVSLRGELDLASAPHLQQVLDQLCRPATAHNLNGDPQRGHRAVLTTGGRPR